MKKFLIYYFIFLFLFLSLFSSGVLDSQDGFQYLTVARNIYYKHEPITPSYSEYNSEKNIYMSSYIGRDGKSYAATGLGYSLALIPAVAITDLFYKIFHLTPYVYFPLENDWLIFLLASFTNAFLAAGLGVILFSYFMELGLSKKQSLFISLVSIFATNLFVYAKNSFAHMLFATFLTLSFLMIKKFYHSQKVKFLIFAGIAYGIMIISYNATFFLTIPSLITYFILLTKPGLNVKKLKSLFKELTYFFIGAFPLILLHIWFENIRSGAAADPAVLSSYATDKLSHFFGAVFTEGLFGQLFSPGRSIFLYSPILLIIVFFWNKIRSKILPELIVFLLMAALYVSFFAMQVTYGDTYQGLQGLWHGETSWGPRYLTPLIPLGMLIVGVIFQRLGKIQRYLFFYPLIVIGLLIELIGVVRPYQIKLYNLEGSFYINSTKFNSSIYSNFIPRYSPVLSMSKSFLKLFITFPKTLNHGIYNVRLYDGIDFPFNVGPERWRVIDNNGFISFDNNQKDNIKKMSFGLINHPLADSSSSAKLQFTLNNKPLLMENPAVLTIKERKILSISIPDSLVKDKNNQLKINIVFDPPLKQKTQILAMISFGINNHTVNLESLDFPYVSKLGPAMAGAVYQNYGSLNKDPWKTWDIHTHMYENTPDFWWVKALMYWDYPRNAIKLILAVILFSTLLLGVKLSSSFKNLK